jgi:hypothetical protein
MGNSFPGCGAGCSPKKAKKRHIVTIPRHEETPYGTHEASNDQHVMVTPYEPEQVAWLETWQPVVVRTVDEWDYPGGQTVEINDYLEYQPVLTPLYSPHKMVMDEWLHSEEFMHDVYNIFVQCDVTGTGGLEWNTGEVRTFMDTIMAEKGWPGLPNDMDLYNLYVQFDMNNDAILELDEACYFAHAVVTIVWKTL